MPLILSVPVLLKDSKLLSISIILQAIVAHLLVPRIVVNRVLGEYYCLIIAVAMAVTWYTSGVIDQNGAMVPIYAVLNIAYHSHQMALAYLERGEGTAKKLMKRKEEEEESLL